MLGFELVIIGMLAHLSNHSTKSHPLVLKHCQKETILAFILCALKLGASDRDFCFHPAHWDEKINSNPVYTYYATRTIYTDLNIKHEL
jgi:hypothetical protein